MALRSIARLVLLVTVISAAAASALQARQAADPSRVAQARDAVYPALVNIEAIVERFVEGRVQRSRSAGSGVVVTAAGHVLTNYHVAGRSVRLSCTLPSGEIIPARVLVHDPLTDLSVLQLELAKRPPGAPPVPFAELGDSDRLEVGDAVLAMGNPLALASSMTLGIVSNPARVFADRGRADVESFDLEDGEPSGLFTRWIQHDALILPGNSGGPLVDLDGRVVGINELGGSGIGFAIPSRIASWVLSQALDQGELVRGWLGIALQPVEALDRDAGALIGSVQPDAPADRAGLRPGDILLTLDGEPLAVRFVEQIPAVARRIAELVPGSTVQVRFERAGKVSEAALEVERMEPFAGTEEEVRELGGSFEELTGPLALARGLPRQGLLVTGVRPGQALDSARPRPQAGDVLIRIDETPIDSLGALREALGEGSPRRLLATLWRDGQELATVVELRQSTARRWGGELPKAWLGINTQVLTADLATALGVAGTRGFRISQVLPGTSAAGSGLTVGDVVVAVDDRELTASAPQDAGELRRLLEVRDPGETVELTVLRGGERQAITALLEGEPLGPDRAREARRDELELTVREITLDDRLRERWAPGTTGALVAEATTGGWAHLAGLRSGDLIIEASGRPISGPTELDRVVGELLAAREPVVPLLVRRGRRTVFVFVEPDYPEESSE